MKLRRNYYLRLSYFNIMSIQFDFKCKMKLNNIIAISKRTYILRRYKICQLYFHNINCITFTIKIKIIVTLVSHKYKIY